MEWKEEDHPIWGKGGTETEALKKLNLSATFPEKIWRSGKFSIIPPCTITFGMWEMYDGEDVERFHTLEEAQQRAEELNRA